MKKITGIWLLMATGATVAYGVLKDQIIIAMLVGAVCGFVGAKLTGFFDED